MNRTKALLVLAALGIGAEASSASAQSMYGSDTLYEVTREALVAAGIPTTAIDYKGTGSSVGGRAMNAGDAAAVPPIPAQNQQIAPQSRFLTGAECGGAIGAGPGTGLMVGLDAIGIYSSAAGGPAAGCQTLRYSGSVGSYAITDWRDTLRLLYAGQSSHATAPACQEDPPARTPSAAGDLVARCGSAERRALISNWSNLFQDAGCSSGSCTGGLRHAFRRDDLSGTTDVFLTLLALPGIPSNGVYSATNRTFCNGNEFEDLDPVRTPCDAREEVCQTIPYSNRTAPASNPAVAGGDLGVVLPITMPTDTTKQFGAACAFGKFAYAPMPFSAALENQRCPDGNGRQGGKCRWPLDASNRFNCRAIASTRPSIRVFTNMDGRSYNLLPRDPATGNLLINPPSGTGDPRWMAAGAYRKHQTTAMTNAPAGTQLCTKADATLQIGCLVQADPCSIGYAGRQALQGNTQVAAIQMRTPDNTASVSAEDVANIQAVADPGNCAAFGARYPLARSLWMNASKGFGSFTTFTNITNGPTAGNVTREKDFMTWIVGNKGPWDTILDANDFIAVPGSFRQRTCASPTAP